MTDAGALHGPDSGGLLVAQARIGEHLREGHRRGLDAPDLPAGDGVRSVAVAGMGGSGLPGDAVHALLANRLGIPIVVTKGYRLPEFCHTDTLLLAVSYSGDTDEVLGVYREAMDRGCRVVAVTSGGRLGALAADEGVARVEVPPDAPVPRAAIGYLTGALLGVLEATGLGPAVGRDVEEAARVAETGAERLGPSAGEAGAALGLARTIGDRVPVIWGSEGVTGAAAVRWRTDFNENAKRPAFSSALPELDHNEIEGWSRGAGRSFFLVVLRAASEHPAVGARVSATLESIADAGLDRAEVRAQGISPLAQLISLVQAGGFVTCFAAQEAGIDPAPIERIQAMKSRLEAAR